MLTLHPHELVRPDATIRYWTGGDTGPTVVLLHGATLDHRAWDPQTEALAEAFRVVVPDLRGHGESDGRFDFEETVQDILALLDHGRSPEVVLVGLSLGANVAQEVLRRDIATATRGWAEREPLAEYAVITGAGHASNLDNPEEFTAVLLEFLGRATALTARQELAA